MLVVEKGLSDIIVANVGTVSFVGQQPALHSRTILTRQLSEASDSPSGQLRPALPATQLDEASEIPSRQF